MSSPVDDVGEEEEERRSIPLRVRYRLTPWWVKVVVIFAVGRLITTILLLILAKVQGLNPWTASSPNLLDFSTIWDGRWYNIVAISGYPSQLPIDTAGHVGQNAWAFLPAYPFLVAILMLLTGLSWPVLSVFVSLAFGLGATLLFYKLMRLRLNASASLFAVVLFSVAPLSPMLQLSYAESMYMFFLVLTLYLLLKRRYWVMLLPVLVMAFTRPSGLAFALAMALHLVFRWVARRKDPFPVRERIAALAVTAVSGFAGLAWPVIAWMATGSPSAYTDTELSWRAAYIGYTDLVPFDSWIAGAKWWFSTWLGLPEWLGYATLLLLVVLFAMSLFTPAVKRLGVDLRSWIAAYGIYLLAVFFPQSSTFRLLMPMFPMLGAAAIPKSRTYRVSLVLLCIAAQLGWLLICWGVDGADWTPP